MHLPSSITGSLLQFTTIHGGHYWPVPEKEPILEKTDENGMFALINNINEIDYQLKVTPQNTTESKIGNMVES